MANYFFENTNSKSKKKKDEDDLFKRVSAYAQKKVIEERSRDTSSPASTITPTGKTPTMPTVSSTVGNHTTDYGKYKAENPTSVSTTTNSNVGIEPVKTEEPEKKWWEKLLDQNEHAKFWDSVLTGEIFTANDIYDKKYKEDIAAIEENKQKEFDKWLVTEVEGDSRVITAKAKAQFGTIEPQDYVELWNTVAQEKIAGRKTDDSGWETAGKSVWAALTGLEEGFYSTVDFIAPTEFLGKYDPFTYLSDQAKRHNYDAQNALSESLEGRGWFGRTASEVGVGLAQMIPDIWATIQTGGAYGSTYVDDMLRAGKSAMAAASKADNLLDSIKIATSKMLKSPGFYISATRTLGSDYATAKENGATEEQAMVYALITTYLNAGIEVSGGIQALPGKLQNKLTSKSAILEWILSAHEEGLEEVVQSFVSGGMEKAIYNPDKPVFKGDDRIVNLPEMAKEYALGTAIGGIAGGAQTLGINAYNKAIDKRVGKVGADYVESADELIESGLSFDDGYKASEIAKELKAKKESGEEVTNEDLGRLVYAIEQSKRTEAKNAPVDTSVDTSVEAPVQSRVQAIQTRLAEGGMDAVQAESVAQSIDRIIAGDITVTGKDKDVLRVGENAARAIFEEETGVKLPSSNASTRKTVAEYIAQTAMKQQKQETVKPNVMEAYQAQKAQEDVARQLKDNFAANPVANATSETLRQAAHQAVVTAQAKTDMASLGEHGKTAYQKHIANAENAITFSNAFQRYYDAGLIGGIAFEEIKTAYDGNIPRTVLYEAYAAGQNDASAAPKGNSPTENKNAQKGKNSPSKGKGRFYDNRTSEGKAASNGKTVNKDVIKALEAFAKVFHVDIELVDTIAPNGVSIANGQYVGGKVVLAADSENPLMTVLKHEVTHHIQRTNPAQYKAFKDYVMKAFYNNSQEEMNAEIQRRLDLARLNNVKLTRDGAMDEIVADATEKFLTDRDSIEALVRENRNLGETILNAIRDVLRKIEAALKGEKIGNGGWWMDTDQLKQAEKMWVEALMSSTMEDNVGIQFDGESESAAPVWSLKTWSESEYVKAREEAAKMMAKQLGITKEKALAYIDDINGIARLIADDRVRLDYDSNLDENATVLKPNSDYKWSVDMSTLCAKRLLFTGTFDAIQRAMPNTVFDSDDLVRLRKMMMDKNLQVACGICYVESTRREIGRITQDFIDRYKEAQKTGKPITRLNSEGKAVELKKTKEQMAATADKSTDKFFADKDYTPTLGELNTTDIDLVKRDHPLVYEAYLNFMNARGQAKPKLLETRAEYKGEILKHFKAKSAVKARNDHGGLRLQSFSDFEVPHMIDMMQVIMDMSRVGLQSQAYTKVPAFAEVFGGTGVKINLSLIAKGDGLDSKGNLIFDDVEGMNHKDAFRLREQYSDNVGTILVGKNDAHIIAAMADPRIDFIIPFHKSSWKESLYDALGLTGYSDYTDTQNEKPIDKDRKISNFDPSEYWDFSKTGDENAQIYLEKCREDGRVPKFPQFQGYPGYWKLLTDFKMYNNDGVGSPQTVVRPDFNMDAATKILNDYEGGHRSFPVAKDVVNEFVSEYTAQKNTTEDGGVQYSLKNVNGKQIVWIEKSALTSKQLDDHTAVAQYIDSHIGEMFTIIESGQKVYIGDDLSGEFTQSKYTDILKNRSRKTLRAKNKTVSELGTLIETATNRRWEPTEHPETKDAKYGMYRYDSSFAFLVGGQSSPVVRSYDVELLIRNASDGKKYLYDIVNIKENTTDAFELQQREIRKGSYAAATHGSASGKTVPQPDDSVKGQFSLKDTDYLAAVNRGDMATAQKMVDEAAKAAWYEHQMFHETDAENIHVFDISRGTHGGADYQTPYGIFTKSSSKNIGLGSRQMALYVKAQNTLRVEDRDDVLNKIPGFAKYYDQITEIDRRYGALANQYEDEEFDALTEWMNEHPEADMDVVFPFEYIAEGKPADIDSERYLEAHKKYEENNAAWTKEYEAVAVKAKDYITNYLRSNGYDSMYFKIDGGSRGRQTDSLIVLDPNQVKSADPVTYDDDGNVIPLSERFNPKKTDIRYSFKVDTSWMDAESQKIVREAEIRTRYSKAVVSMTDDRLNKTFSDLEDYGSPTTAHGYLAYIDPWDFLHMTTTSVNDFLERAPNRLNEGVSEDWGTKNNITNPDAMYLRIDEDGRVTGHEGRHRMAALYREGYEKVAIQIRTDAVKDAKPIHIQEIKDQWNGRFSINLFRLIPVSKEYREVNKSLFGHRKTFPGETPENIQYQLKTPPELLEISKQIAEEQHKAQAVTDAEIMSQKLNAIAKTDEEKAVVRNYQNAMKKLADYEKELAVYDATKGEHDKGRSIYTDASGKVKKSGVKYSAAEKAEIQRKIELWKRNLHDIERKEAFQKVLKREKAKMAETHAKKMSDLREAYNKRLDALRSQRDAKVDAEKQKMRDYKQHQRDSKAYKELKAKLEADVKWLGDRLVHPTDAKHIPEDFKKVVAKFLESLDFTTKGMDENIAKTGKPSQKFINMWSMIEAYQKIANDESSGIELTPIEDAMMKSLQKTFENGKRVQDLDYDELEMVYDIIRWIKTGVASANKTFNENIKETISEIGDTSINELRGKKAKKERAGLAAEAEKLLGYDNITPADMFHRFGGTMEKLYGEIRDGFNKHIENVRTAIYEVSKITNGHEEDIKKWSGKKAKATQFSISDGTTIELTPAQVMSLYVLMKREQAAGHVLGSGIVPSDVVVSESKKVGKGNITLNTTKKITAERASQVTIEDVAKIVETLNDDQKRIADSIVRLFTTKCADWGNETSMKLYGYKKFTEKNYFPIKSSDAYLNARFDEGGDVLIKNLGMTKNTVVNANNPIVVEDIFDVLTDHVNKMSMYNALVAPLTDFTRVYNYKTRDTDGNITDSVQKALEAAHGKQAIAYVTQFMKDVNKQANTLAAESLANKALTAFKKGKVGANLRVLAQQPTSIVRAAAIIDPKYILAGLKQKANYKELFETSEIAYWKSLGFFETDVSRSMKDILMNDENWLDKYTMGMYGKADDFAWGHLWNAVKMEQADAHPDMDKTSSEFMDLVKARFEEIVDRTQVVDSVFHRSQIMRSKSVFTKMLTAFMSEPTKTYNLLVTDLSDAVKTKDKKKAGRAIGTFVASAIATSMASALLDAIRDDEDEDKEGNKRGAVRKYFEALGRNILDNINPAGLVPYVKDVVSLISGYEVKRTDMDMVSDFVKVAKKWTTGKHSYTYLIKETAASFAEIFGIPVKNALRDLDAIVGSTANLFGGLGYADYWLEKRRYDISNPDNRSKFYKHYTDALLAGDQKTADAILADMVANGIPYENIIAKGYQKEKEVAFKEAKKLLDKGKDAEAKALVRDLAKKYKKKYSTLWKSVRDGNDADEPEETYDFGDLRKAIRRSEDTEEIEEYLIKYGGYSKKDIKEAIAAIKGE